LENSQGQLGIVNTNTKEIMALRENIVRENGDKIASLMYSNIIQQNLRFANSLHQQILALKKEINKFEDHEQLAAN
jgi:hypothetical protein